MVSKRQVIWTRSPTFDDMLHHQTTFALCVAETKDMRNLSCAAQFCGVAGADPPQMAIEQDGQAFHSHNNFS